MSFPFVFAYIPFVIYHHYRHSSSSSLHHHLPLCLLLKQNTFFNQILLFFLPPTNIHTCMHPHPHPHLFISPPPKNKNKNKNKTRKGGRKKIPFFFHQCPSSDFSLVFLFSSCCGHGFHICFCTPSFLPFPNVGSKRVCVSEGGCVCVLCVCVSLMFLVFVVVCVHLGKEERLLFFCCLFHKT